MYEAHYKIYTTTGEYYKVMIKIISIVVGSLILIVGGFFALNNYIYTEKQADTSVYTLGTYGYLCEEGTEFTMSPSSDMTSIYLVPATDAERIPETILPVTSSSRGARFEGNGIVFYAIGETVTLSTEEFTTTCSPVQIPDEAPFNFGD